MNPALNGLIIPLYDQAREQAAGALSGPLAGVPMLTKDLFQEIGGADGAVLMDGPVHKKNRFNQWERRWLIVEADRIHYVKSPLTYQDGGYSRVVATAEQAPDFTAARTSQSVHELVITVGDAELIFYVGTEEMRDKWFKELLAWAEASGASSPGGGAR